MYIYIYNVKAEFKGIAKKETCTKEGAKKTAKKFLLKYERQAVSLGIRFGGVQWINRYCLLSIIKWNLWQNWGLKWILFYDIKEIRSINISMQLMKYKLMHTYMTYRYVYMLVCMYGKSKICNHWSFRAIERLLQRILLRRFVPLKRLSTKLLLQFLLCALIVFPINEWSYSLFKAVSKRLLVFYEDLLSNARNSFGGYDIPLKGRPQLRKFI